MVQIRSESPLDVGRIFEIEAAAFARPNEAELVDVLRASAHPQLSLVAEAGPEIVGHIFFSPVSLASHPDAGPLAALGPVAVAPTHQGSGIGSALVRAGLERCPEHRWGAVFLVGNPAYYGRFGFELAAPLGFTYGNELFDPVFQVIELAAGTPHRPRRPGRISSCLRRGGIGSTGETLRRGLAAACHRWRRPKPTSKSSPPTSATRRMPAPSSTSSTPTPVIRWAAARGWLRTSVSDSYRNCGRARMYASFWPSTKTEGLVSQSASSASPPSPPARSSTSTTSPCSRNFADGGAGRALLGAVEAHAREHGCCKLTLEVQHDNERARALYASFGFGDFAPGADPIQTFFLQKKV